MGYMTNMKTQDTNKEFQVSLFLKIPPFIPLKIFILPKGSSLLCVISVSIQSERHGGLKFILSLSLFLLSGCRKSHDAFLQRKT